MENRSKHGFIKAASAARRALPRVPEAVCLVVCLDLFKLFDGGKPHRARREFTRQYGVYTHTVIEMRH
jgi:hypothetical protein